MNDVLNLPKQWVQVTVADLGKVVSGGTPATKENSYWGGSISWISPSDLTGYSNKYISKGAKSITLEGLENSSATIMPAGSIHFSSRAPVGYTVISSQNMTTNQGFKSLVPVQGIFNEYIYYYFKSAKQLAESKATGTTFKEISGAAFSKLPVPLPPTNEQHRIVAKIEELFSELDKGIENLKTARAQLKVYRQALLKHAFAGNGLVQKKIIAQPFGLDCCFTLGDVILTLGQGWSPRCLETPSQSDDVWGVIRTTAIQPLHFDDSKNKELPLGLAPRPHLEIFSGDILITRAGPRNRVGIACFVKKARPKLMVCDKAYRIQVHKEKILPQYLVMLLNTSEVLSELEKLKSGINDSGLNLTQNKFLTMKIMVPSLAHQQLILDDIEEKLSVVDQLDQTITTSLQQAEALRQSILKKAFSGQLVPQDPHDEPASALLARITAERATVANNATVAASTRTTKRKSA